MKSEKVSKPSKSSNFQNKGRGENNTEEAIPTSRLPIKGLMQNVKRTMQNNVDASIQRQQGSSNAPRMIQRQPKFPTPATFNRPGIFGPGSIIPPNPGEENYEEKLAEYKKKLDEHMKKLAEEKKKQ